MSGNTLSQRVKVAPTFYFFSIVISHCKLSFAHFARMQKFTWQVFFEILLFRHCGSHDADPEKLPVTMTDTLQQQGWDSLYIAVQIYEFG